jgi:hypothetical protein
MGYLAFYISDLKAIQLRKARSLCGSSSNRITYIGAVYAERFMR